MMHHESCRTNPAAHRSQWTFVVAVESPFRFGADDQYCMYSVMYQSAALYTVTVSHVIPGRVSSSQS